MNLNPVYDAQIIQYRQRESTVDGHGQLITPYGTHEVVRIHHSITEIDSLRITIGSFNQWIPINRTINEYEWWDNDLKRPVLKIETEGALSNESATRITFLNDQIANLNKDKVETVVFPNPASDFISLHSLEMIESVKIYSLDGQQVFSKDVSSKKTILNLVHLSPGMYTLKVHTKNGHHFKPIIIK